MKHSKLLLYTPLVKAVLTYGPGTAGRFGGGFNWKLGVQAGHSTIVVSLLIADLRVDLGPLPRTEQTVTRTDTPLGDSLTGRGRREPVT